MERNWAKLHRQYVSPKEFLKCNLWTRWPQYSPAHCVVAGMVTLLEDQLLYRAKPEFLAHPLIGLASVFPSYMEHCQSTFQKAVQQSFKDSGHIPITGQTPVSPHLVLTWQCSPSSQCSWLVWVPLKVWKCSPDTVFPLSPDQLKCHGISYLPRSGHWQLYGYQPMQDLPRLSSSKLPGNHTNALSPSHWHLCSLD